MEIVNSCHFIGVTHYTHTLCRLAKNTSRSMGINEIDRGDDDDKVRPFEWLTSPASLRDMFSDFPPQGNKRALHIGSGSSTLGEFLVEELSYQQVLDVDKDEETLQRMKQRWHERCLKTGVDESRLEHVVADFAESTIDAAEEASFSLVLDKSTLDCTLCSENATASLLLEVYRCLAAGGVYVVISFQEKDLLLPLLRDLPGASWEIACQEMTRQVEKLDTTIPFQINESNVGGSHETQAASPHPPLNVLIARKSEQEVNHSLSLLEARNHVHRVNDAWFQQSRPLLTRQRHELLRSSFAKPLSVEEAYKHLFTDAEREHLPYDFFLEDWQAFCEQRKLAVDSCLTYALAVEFLNDMQ